MRKYNPLFLIDIKRYYSAHRYEYAIRCTRISTRKEVFRLELSNNMGAQYDALVILKTISNLARVQNAYFLSEIAIVIDRDNGTSLKECKQWGYGGNTYRYFEQKGVK